MGGGGQVIFRPDDITAWYKSRTVGYNNKTLVSDSGFSLGKNNMVNTSAPSHRTPIVHAPCQEVRS